MWEDEASFWLDGTLHRTWARVGQQPRVDTYGERKTAHLYGAVTLADARFTYLFAEVFNAQTFLRFLKQLVRQYPRRRIFLIMDNGPCHNLDEAGKWRRARGSAAFRARNARVLKRRDGAWS